MTTSNAPIDFFADAVFSIAARWRGEVDPVLTYAAMFDVLRQRRFSGKFLELGGGYSTILAPVSLKLPSGAIHSVDFNPRKYRRILNSAKNSEAFLKQIHLYPGISVSFEQVVEGLDEILNKISSYPPKKIQDAFATFGLGDLIQIDERQAWIAKVRELFLSHPAATEERVFYSSMDAMDGEKLCSAFVAEKAQFDAIFFDCGELSSIGEFALMMPTMKCGSYVLLHDIYYPKSIKNFLVAIYLELDDSWEILYLDNASPQGGLVAIKL